MTRRLGHRRDEAAPRRGRYSVDERWWFDEDRRAWFPTTDDRERLRVELQDAGSTSWLASIAGTLANQSGQAHLRFVGRVTADDGRPGRVIAGPTFLRPRSVPDTIGPDERWCPGMGDALEGLRRRLDAEGWLLVDCGDEPWSDRYERPGIDWSRPTPEAHGPGTSDVSA